MILLPNMGGGQNIVTHNADNQKIKIPMSFDGDTMSVPIREPTDDELKNLSIIWLIPSIDDEKLRPIRRRRVDSDGTRRVSFAQVDSDSEELVEKPTESNQIDKVKERWNSCLGFPTEKTMNKTLEMTTQLREEPVEMENREFPRQHRKKRFPSLHVRRVPGRVDSDTFYNHMQHIKILFARLVHLPCCVLTMLRLRQVKNGLK